MRYGQKSKSVNHCDFRNPVVRSGFCYWALNVGAHEWLVQRTLPGAFCLLNIEIFGRRYIFIISFMLLSTFSAVSAASQDISTLAVTRFSAGALGSSPLTNGAGILADMFPASQRGMTNTLYAAAPFLGPVIGPIGECEPSELTWKLMLCSGWVCWPNH